MSADGSGVVASAGAGLFAAGGGKAAAVASHTSFRKLLASDYCADIAGNAWKNFLLGWMLTNFSDHEADWVLAVSYFERAGELGCVQAYNNLARMYEHGVGTGVSHEKSVHYAERAAEAGYGKAWSSLGFLYKKEGGATLEKVEACFLKALACGHTVSACNLAYLYLFDEVGQKEFRDKQVQALIHLKDVERTEHPGTLYILGRIYQEGYAGIQVDLEKAQSYYQRGAELGHYMSFKALSAFSEDFVRAEELEKEYLLAKEKRSTAIGCYRMHQSQIEVGGYEFNDTRLFLRAMASDVALRELGLPLEPFADLDDQEVLEWKGDGVLNSAVRVSLSVLSTTHTRRELDLWYQRLVCNADEGAPHGGPLYRVAKSMRLQPLVMLQEAGGMRVYPRRGKHSKKRTVEAQLSNCVEILIGAIVSDGGEQAAKAFVIRQWEMLGLNELGVADPDYGQSDDESFDARIRPK